MVRLGLAILVAFGLPQSAHAAATSRLAAIVAGSDGQPAASGIVIVAADARGVLRTEAAGRAIIDATSPERERPLTPATPMRVASISKLVVAISVMRLVEAGTLDLDADVSRWLGWDLRNPAHPMAPVSLRQLLSHTSGIVDGPGYTFAGNTRLRDNLVPAHWSAAAPGGRFAYANLNYGIIATVMEAATGTRFDRLMTGLVLAPLGLDAGYNWSGSSDAAVAAAAALYRKGEGGTVWAPAGPWIAQVDDLRGVRPACPVAGPAPCALAGYRPGDNGTLFSPQGGLRISGLGLAMIGRLLLRGGEVDGVRLLSKASVAALLTPVWRDTGRAGDDTYQGVMRCYGPGLQCLSGEAGASDQPVPPDARGSQWWGHLGEAYGLYGGLWVDRAGGRVLVYLISGTSDDPYKAPHVSGFAGIEEAVLRELAGPAAAR